MNTELGIGSRVIEGLGGREYENVNLLQDIRETLTLPKQNFSFAVVPSSQRSECV